MGKPEVKLPEVEVQSFAVTLRYMYTDCIFPLVKGDDFFPFVVYLVQNIGRQTKIVEIQPC